MKTKLLRGFTLIELMIVVAVIAIIAAIAIPNYQDYIRSTRRGAAAACLAEAEMVMNKRKASNLPYDVTTTFPALGCLSSVSEYYDLSFSGGTLQPNAFTIQATPRAGHGQTNDGCGILTLNQLGVKGADAGAADAATVKKCWK